MPDLPTLRELLRRPAFSDAEILAGRQGLDAPVRWVHVGEIPDVASYLRGQELVLSTGVGLHRPQERRRYLERLAGCKVAGVCIELGRYLQRVPKDMIELADHLELPLVAFVRPVRFVDITRDVHEVILQGEQRILLSLRQLADELRLAQGGNDPQAEIVGRLGVWLDDATVFLPAEGEPLHAGAPPRVHALETKVPDLRLVSHEATAPSAMQLADGSRVLWRIVPQRDGDAGLLVAACHRGDELSADMALELGAAALAQVPSREQRHSSLDTGDDELLAALLRGEGQGLGRPLTARLGEAGRLPVRAVLVLLRPRKGQASPLMPAFQAVLRQTGMRALGAERGSDVALLLFDPPSRGVLRSVLADLGAASEPFGGAAMGASTTLPLHGLAAANSEAGLALAASVWSEGASSAFYDELGALRVLANLRQDFDTAAVVEQEIGPLLSYDRRHMGHLLETLDVLLKVPHKDEAARRLGIRRQTLYYRIERIAFLLGEDFLQPERRLGLTLALLARLLTRDVLDTL